MEAFKILGVFKWFYIDDIALPTPSNQVRRYFTRLHFESCQTKYELNTANNRDRFSLLHETLA